MNTKILVQVNMHICSIQIRISYRVISCEWKMSLVCKGLQIFYDFNAEIILEMILFGNTRFAEYLYSNMFRYLQRFVKMCELQIS